MSSSFIDRMNCEICGSGSPAILKSVPYRSGRITGFLDTYYSGRIPAAIIADACYEVRKCNACGFVWQGYILNESMMAELYDAWISADESLDKKRYADASLFIRYARECETISRLFPGKPFQIQVLDYGMGWGYWCHMAKAFGYNVTGYEVSRARVDYARKRGIDAIDDLPTLMDRRFDFVNCEQVLEHVSKPLDTLRNIALILNPDGVIRAAVPDGRGVESILADPEWSAAKDALHPLEHINCFNHEAMVRMGIRAGLELHEVLRGPQRLAGDAVAFTKALARKLFRKVQRPGGTALYFRKRRDSGKDWLG